MIRCGYCMAGGLTRQRCLTADKRWQSQSDMSEQMKWDTRCSASQSSARKLVTCFKISDPGGFNWEEFCSLCADYKIGYQGVPLDIKWRIFRFKSYPVVRRSTSQSMARLLFSLNNHLLLQVSDNKMTFLSNKFAMYRLEDDNAEHQQALWILKTCAAAQVKFRRPTTTDRTILCTLWEAERDRVYKELEKAAGAAIGLVL